MKFIDRASVSSVPKTSSPSAAPNVGGVDRNFTDASFDEQNAPPSICSPFTPPISTETSAALFDTAPG